MHTRVLWALMPIVASHQTSDAVRCDEDLTNSQDILIRWSGTIPPYTTTLMTLSDDRHDGLQPCLESFDGELLILQGDIDSAALDRGPGDKLNWNLNKSLSRILIIHRN